MRTLFVVSFAVFSFAAQAQDAGQMAIQQMQMQQVQTQQTQLQQTQLQSQLANDEMIRQTTAASQFGTTGVYVFKPALSVVPGSYASAVTLRMKDRSRGTAIYYTTDGWTPTTLSTRYTGPITLTETTTLQAIAVTAKGDRSLLVSATYSIAGSQPASVSAVFPAGAPGTPLLPPGAQLPLLFKSAVSSRGLQVGDALPISLAADLTVGGQVLARRGTPVLATVTQVDGAGRMGLPGAVTFTVHSLTLNDGTTLALSGTRTREGDSQFAKAVTVGIIPGGGLFVRGRNAEIAAGTPLTAQAEAITTNQAQLVLPRH